MMKETKYPKYNIHHQIGRFVVHWKRCGWNFPLTPLILQTANNKGGYANNDRYAPYNEPSFYFYFGIYDSLIICETATMAQK